MQQSTMWVHVRTVSTRDNGNGTFDIELPCDPLPPDELEMLERRFKHTFQEVETLLSKEALMGAIATRAEVVAPANKAYCNQSADQLVKKAKGNIPQKADSFS